MKARVYASVWSILFPVRPGWQSVIDTGRLYHIGAHIPLHRGEDRRKDMAETRKILSGHVGRKGHVTGPSARIGLCI